jgi:pimeloyl-ACP methyl ester carboxylesterase
VSPGAHNGWTVHESGPAGAEHAALLLPGGLCTAAFYDDVLADPRLKDAPIRFAATTVPGFGGTPPLDDLRFESYAAAELAADLGCDVVVGHSMGANLVIEMLGAGQFKGPAVLLSPSFSREDEFTVMDVMDRVGRVPGLGRLAWAAMLKAMPRGMKKEFPPERGDALVAEMQGNDPRVCRALVRHYLDYLDRHESLVSRLCGSGVRSWTAFGDSKGEVGLTDDERQALETCPSVELVTIRGSGHLALNDNPDVVAGLILAAVDSVAHAPLRAT